ncbi:glycosyl hydrolase [Luteimicrobium album]|uniref:Glycosyl hydrolase n=1 Tax=Luteimicrobium album TaxID=1054550 RepID=A0ABQ6I2N6_9MICO|nr:sialidase family protein [Luteimicrobium album]GMA24194.1 glycosyl hydrolase [Luteimicrobium album]
MPGHEELSSCTVPTPVGHNHASFLHRGVDGDLWCTWFGGTHEGKPDVSIYASRLPAGGTRWTPAVKLSDDPGRSEQNPVLWSPEDGTLELLYTAQVLGSQDTSVVRRRRSTDGGRTWGDVEQVFDEPGLFIRQRPTTLRDGLVLLPVFRCTTLPGRSWKGDADVSLVALSRDRGRTWELVEVPGTTGLVHMDVLPDRAGTGLVAFFRSRWADFVYRATSQDGRSWTAPQPLDVPNNNSSIQAARLGDGRLVLAHNPVNAAMSPPVAVDDDPSKIVAAGERSELDREAVWGVRRVPLVLSVSEDDGLTWGVAVVVEAGTDRAGEAVWAGLPDAAEMSYPSVVRDGDAVWLSYSYDRVAIKVVRVPSTELVAPSSGDGAR